MGVYIKDMNMPTSCPCKLIGELSAKSALRAVANAPTIISTEEEE